MNQNRTCFCPFSFNNWDKRKRILLCWWDVLYTYPYFFYWTHSQFLLWCYPSYKYSWFISHIWEHEFFSLGRLSIRENFWNDGNSDKVSYTANAYRGLWFSMQYLWKRAVRITEKPYTPQRERLCMLWGKPCNIYRL